jgi:hypothetical protein
VTQWLQKPTHILLATLMMVPFAITFRFYQVHAGNVPYADQWCDAVPMVIQASDGEMQPWRPFAQHNAHRIVSASTTTLANLYLTNWNLKTETAFNFVLAALNLFILMWALRQREGMRGELWLLAGILMSALIFIVRSRVIWLWAYSSPYIILYTFALLGAVILARTKPGPGPLSAALILNLLAIWSIGSGAASLFLLPVGLWLTGYRKWWHYAAWIGVVALAFYVYFYQFDRETFNFCLGYTGTVAGDPNFPLTERLLRLPTYLMSSMAGVLLTDYPTDAHRLRPVGFWLGFLLLVNGLYMLRVWWQRRDGGAAFIWMNVLGPAIGGTALIAVGRAGRDAGNYYFASNYSYQAAMILVALAGLAVAAVHVIHRRERPAWWERALLLVNTVSVALFVFLYVNVVATTTNVWRFPHGAPSYLNPDYASEVCLRNMFYVDDYDAASPPCYSTVSAFGDWMVTVDDYNIYTRRLAELRLTAFADIQHQLPSEYDAGHPVLVQADLAAQHLPILDGDDRRVPESDILRIVDSEDQIAALERQNAVHIQVGDGIPFDRPFWYFSLTNELPDGYSYLWHGPQNAVAFAAREPYDLRPMYLGLPLPPEDTRHAPIVFGDTFRMVDWQIVGDVQQNACGAVQLHSWWELVSDQPDQDFTLATVAVAPDDPTDALVQIDAPLGSSLDTSAWERGYLYFNSRQIDIPCEAEAGEYALINSVYFYREPDAPLLASTDDGNELGNSTYLTTLFVVE